MAFIPPIIAAVAAAASSASAAAGSAAAAVGSVAAGASASDILATAGSVAGLAGAGIGAYGAYQQGQATKAAAKYNEQVALENSQVAKQNVQIAGQSGAEQAGISSQKARATVGAIMANQAASGLDVNSGSAIDVRSSARELGMLDALTVRSNAVRQAYGYEVQGVNEQAEAGLQQLEAESAQQAGDIGAASTLLGGIGSAGYNFGRYLLNGGFGSTPNIASGV